jgi:hypothetical protein
MRVIAENIRENAMENREIEAARRAEILSFDSYRNILQREWTY